MMTTTPVPTEGLNLLEYGPVGAFALVMLVVLGALYKMYDGARKADSERLKDQLGHIKEIAIIQQQTAAANTTSVQVLSVVTSRMDDLIRDLRDVAERASK